MRPVHAAYAAFLLVLLALGLAGASFAIGETTGTVVACATATAPAHTVAVDGTDVRTIPGDVVANCETSSYTVPTVTETVISTAPITSTTTTTTPTVGTVPGVAVVKWGGGSFGDLPHPERLSGCISSLTSQPAVGSLPCRSLIYINHTNVPYGVGWNAGVSWQQMDANNWWLRDSAGNKVHYGSCTSGEYLADISLPGYRQAFINGVMPLLDQFPGLDGFYLDNVLGAAPSFCVGNQSAKFPTNSAYQQAQLDFLAAVMPTVRAKAYVTANVLQCCDNDGNLNIAWAQKVMPYLDGDSMEYYQYIDGGKLRINGSAWDQQWANWQRIVGVVQGMGKDWNPTVSWPNCANSANSTYIKASYLLDWNGSGFMIGSCPAYESTTDPTVNWAAPWLKDMGVAEGAKTQLANGVWKRVFANGEVLVNPTGSTQTADGHSLASGSGFIG